MLPIKFYERKTEIFWKNSAFFVYNCANTDIPVGIPIASRSAHDTNVWLLVHIYKTRKHHFINCTLDDIITDTSRVTRIIIPIGFSFSLFIVCVSVFIPLFFFKAARNYRVLSIEKNATQQQISYNKRDA